MWTNRIFFRLLSIIFISGFFGGCVNVHVQRLPAYDLAMKFPGSDRPKLFIEGTNRIESAMTAFAIISAVGDAGRDTIIRNIWWKAAELRADVVIIRDVGSQYAGSVATSAYLGYGISTAILTPVYNRNVTGICFRLNPSKVGFRTDQNMMITDIVSDSLRGSGILEGDKVISVNDFSYIVGNTPEMLSLNPSQEVKITVVRPGVGKITKTVRTISNDPSYKNYSDSVTWEDAPKPVDQNKCSSSMNCP
jgi:hypothetical protein